MPRLGQANGGRSSEKQDKTHNNLWKFDRSYYEVRHGRAHAFYRWTAPCGTSADSRPPRLPLTRETCSSASHPSSAWRIAQLAVCCSKLAEEGLMAHSLEPDTIREPLARLQAANLAFAAAYPGESGERQAVPTVYGGAHRFKADTARKMGDLALRTLGEYYPNFAVFARALGLPGAEQLPEAPEAISALASNLAADADAVRRRDPPAWFAHTVYGRVVEKLKRQPIEDFRIDFEDGYGNRPEADEDGHAASAAEEVARGLEAGTLPPFLGIRIKPLSEELRQRSLRTLDHFITTLAEKSRRRLPQRFVVTLPK